MIYPSPEEHNHILEDLQWLRYYVKNMHTKRTVDNVRDAAEKIRSRYGHVSAQPTNDVLGLLEAGRYNDERIDMLLDVQADLLKEYLAAMSEYRDDYSILNDGWH
jgi:hypothetical protein